MECRRLRGRHLLSRRFAKPGSDTPELDARVLIGHALRLDHAPLCCGWRSDASRRGNEIDCRAHEAPAWARAGRAHHRRQGILEPAVARVTAATLVPRPETETVVEAALAAIDADGSRSRTLASPTSAPARAHLLALLSSCRTLAASAPMTKVARRLRSHAKMPGASGLSRAPNSSPAISLRRCAVSFDLSSQSALHRPRTKSPHWRRRCATMTRALHSTAGRTASMSTAPSLPRCAHAARARRRSCRRTRRRPGAIGRGAICRGWSCHFRHP